MSEISAMGSTISRRVQGALRKWNLLAADAPGSALLRTLALEDAAQRRRIHQRLVETLFRYKSRPRVGGFLHRREELAARG